MNSASVSDNNRRAEAALRRQAWVAEGKMEAFRFALQHSMDILQLRAKIQEIEDLISDPDLTSGPMAPGAGPRIFREGYLVGLQEAIDIILGSLK